VMFSQDAGLVFPGITAKGRKKTPGYSSPVPYTLLSATGCHTRRGLGPLALRHSLSTVLPLSFACGNRSVFRRSDKMYSILCLGLCRGKVCCIHTITLQLYFVNSFSFLIYFCNLKPLCKIKKRCRDIPDGVLELVT